MQPGRAASQTRQPDRTGSQAGQPVGQVSQSARQASDRFPGNRLSVDWINKTLSQMRRSDRACALHAGVGFGLASATYSEAKLRA